jgi:hypothetical protein
LIASAKIKIAYIPEPVAVNKPKIVAIRRGLIEKAVMP